jgi:replication-associated recombination protein RarA
MNTNYKYRPKNIEEFIFANDKLECQIRKYSENRSMLPLILHGKFGTGKSLLAELIPKAIDGNEVFVNYVNAEDLNSANEVRTKFFRSSQFDHLFTPPNGQKNNYTVVEEVNFDPKAKGALRVCLDKMANRELFIFTTNDVHKIDEGLLSRSEVVEVSPIPPDRFLSRAQFIFRNEGIDLSDSEVFNLLDAVFEADGDNRSYYKVLDEVIESYLFN